MTYCLKILKRKATPLKVKLAVFDHMHSLEGILILERMSLEEIRRPAKKSSRGKEAEFFFFPFPFSLNMLAAWHSIQPISPAASPVSTDGISEVKITQE